MRVIAGHVPAFLFSGERSPRTLIAGEATDAFPAVALSPLVLSSLLTPLPAALAPPGPASTQGLRMKLYVGNLGYSVSDSALRELFTPFGAVDSARVITDRDSGSSKGFGFVEMPDAGEAQKAMRALNGREVGGRALRVNEARPPESRGAYGGGGGGRGRGRY